MSRSNVRTLVAVAAVAALTLVTGCSLLGGEPVASKPPAPPKPPAAKTTPVTSKTTSGTAIAVPGAKQVTKISSDIDGADLREQAAKGALVVDLRSKEDFKKEHIDGAVNVPLGTLTETAKKWDRKRAVVVYDRTGPDGQAAQTWLERAGFTRIYHLFLGIEGYDEALVGDSPEAMPAREPELYYFYVDLSHPLPLWADAPPFTLTSLQGAEDFIGELKKEYDGRFVLHKIDVTTPEGLSTLIEFEGKEVPMFRLIDEHGRNEQYTGMGTIQTVRAHLKRAIDAYEADPGS